jgi:hypothetical protein
MTELCHAVIPDTEKEKEWIMDATLKPIMEKKAIKKS